MKPAYSDITEKTKPRKTKGKKGIYFFKYLLSFKTRNKLKTPPKIREKNRVEENKSASSQKARAKTTKMSPKPKIVFFKEIKKITKPIINEKTIGYTKDISKFKSRRAIQ